MAYCSKCGTEISDGAKFCPKCGTNVEVISSEASPKEGRKKTKWFIASIILIILIIGGWLLWNRIEKDYSLEGLAKAAVKYDSIGDFCEGFAMVRKGEKVGYIDKMGNETIPCIYDEIIPTRDDLLLERNDFNFHNGLSFVCKDGKYFFINTEGKEAFPFKYESAEKFSEGLAVVCKDNKYGYIDTKGNEVIPLTDEFLYFGFSEGLAAVWKNDEVGYIDKTGKIVIPIQKRSNWICSFHEGLAVIEKNGKNGYIDTKGNEVITCKFDYASDFSEGLAIVRKNEKGGYIDKTGREVIPCVFDETNDFSEGLAAVSKDGKKFYINKEGKEAFPCSYDDIGDFHEGLASVRKGNLHGAIDMSGKEIIPCTFSSLSSFSEGLAVIEKEGVYGFVDKKGNSTFDIHDEEVKRVVNANIQEKEERRKHEEAERQKEEEMRLATEDSYADNDYEEDYNSNQNIDITPILYECQEEITSIQREIESTCRTFAVLASDDDIDMFKYSQMKSTFTNGVDDLVRQADRAFDRCAKKLQEAGYPDAVSKVNEEKRQFNDAIYSLKMRTLQQVDSY